MSNSLSDSSQERLPNASQASSQEPAASNEAAPSGAINNSAASPASIKAPRSAFIDYFLCVVTFSVFIMAWIYQAVRDVNRIREQNFTPWLWVFVPFFVLPMFFALPALLRAAKDCEAHLQLPSWSKGQDIGWLVSVWALSIGTVVMEYFAVSTLQQFMLLAVWLAALLSIAPRINRIREASTLPKTKLIAKLSNPEWLVALISVPIICFIIWFAGLQTHFVSLDKLQNNHLIENQALGFTLQFSGNSWHQVEIGTHSNGEAIMEFTGFDSNASLIIFEQEDRDNISPLTQWRVDDASESMNNANCEESRSFIPSSLYLRIRILCKGTSFGDDALQIHEIIQTGKTDYIEAYASYSAPGANFTQDSEAFLRTVQSLTPFSLKNSSQKDTPQGDSK